MSIWNRILVLFKIKTSKALDSMEKVGDTLDYSYEEQLRQLQNVKRGIADLTTAKKRVEMQVNNAKQSVAKLDGQAKAALEAGREDLAREALTRKAAAAAQLPELETQFNQLQTQQDNLVAGEKRLQQKIESFRTQKEVIKAQYSAAEAQVRIGEAATGIGRNMADTGLAIQRAQDKVEQMTARAAAIDELTTAGALDDFTGGPNSLDRELNALSQSSAVEDDLARLKGELGSGEATPALEAGDTSASAVKPKETELS
jgi:phage shock protein A